ncbi:DUF2971 domain-containing protein [Pseudomonadota bacterium]
MTESNDVDRKKLWRYIPLISLLDLLQTGELRLPRADSFEDIQEGHIGLDAILKSFPTIQLYQHKEALERQNTECFVSCWHLSSSESLAMWKVYGGHAFSVALVSNVGKVVSACHEHCKDLSSTGMFGEVIYDNYVSDGKINVETMGLPFGYRDLPVPISIQTLFMKAQAFSYEQEWRLVLHKPSIKQSSIRISIPNIEEFIEAIYISPEAPEWMIESIKRLISDQFGFTKISVSKSPLCKHFKIS